MSDNLKAVIRRHLDKLDDELEKFQELMKTLEPEEGPDNWRGREMIANRLHNFYMGVEQILERVAKELEPSGVPEGPRWQQSLLEQMTDDKDEGPAVINPETRKNLVDFLSFRHFIRQGYAVDVEWEMMRDLVQKYEQVHRITVRDIKKFLKKLEEN